MSKYAVNEEGIQALSTMARFSVEAVSQIESLTARVSFISDNNASVLGPHKRSLDTAIEDINSSLRQAAEPVGILSEKLQEAADVYSEIIENDRFISGSNASSISDSPKGGQSKKGSFISRIFGGKGESSGSQRFGSFETWKYKNGDYVVKGDNFEQYMSDYYDSDNSDNDSLGDNSVVEIISPSKIEGIHLGATEMEDNGRFWSQHETGGTADSFKEIASHIPEVRSQLESGRSLSEIRANPDLCKCADIYFDPSNIPQVIKNDGYYEFYGNGRHRILAARELGYDIPVRVISIRTRK